MEVQKKLSECVSVKDKVDNLSNIVANVNPDNNERNHLRTRLSCIQ